MNRYLVFLFVFLGNNTLSQNLYVGQVSHHFTNRGGGYEYRESHPLLIYETNNNIFLGCYRNSLNRDSCGIGYRYVMIGTENKNIGIKFGVISGYDLPVFAAVNLQLGTLDVNLVPTKVISVGLKIKLN